MNVHVDPSDEREVEVLAAGPPIRHGAQLAVDITLRSVLTCCGAPRPNAAAVNGAILTQARRDKEARYSELVAAKRSRLVVDALETGGRWKAQFHCGNGPGPGERRTVPAAQIRILGVEEAVDQNVAGLLRQVVRLFLGCRSARRDVGGRWSDT